MRKYLAAAVLAAAIVAMSSEANASYIVDAFSAKIPAPLDTGLSLNPADLYQFSVENPSTIWSAGAGSQYLSTADGIPLAVEIASGFGHLHNGVFVPGGWEDNGFVADFGALIGYTPTNGYFFIGTGRNLSGLSGDLSLLYWDAWLPNFDGYSDNSGTQTLDIADLGEVPEPITLSIFGAGLVGLVARRRVQKKPA